MSQFIKFSFFLLQGSPPVPYSFIPSESEEENPNKLFLGGISAEVKKMHYFGNTPVSVSVSKRVSRAKWVGFKKLKTHWDTRYFPKLK